MCRAHSNTANVDNQLGHLGMHHHMARMIWIYVYTVAHFHQFNQPCWLLLCP